MSNLAVAKSPVSEFEVHWARGRFNALFFGLMGPYLNWNLRRHKQRVFDQLPNRVVEIGSGVGANLRYLSADALLVAIEPNPHMHRRLHAAARRKGVRLELHDQVGERIDLPDDSVDAVISSLVLCTVAEPAQVTGRDPSHPAPGRPLQLCRTRRCARAYPHPVPPTNASPSMGLGLRRMLLRTRSRNFHTRRRLHRHRHRAISTPHTLHPVQHPHRWHGTHLIETACSRECNRTPGSGCQ